MKNEKYIYGGRSSSWRFFSTLLDSVNIGCTDIDLRIKTMNQYKDIYDESCPPMLKQQVDPFGINSDIDFIERDEASYFAMEADINCHAAIGQTNPMGNIDK